MEQNVFDAMMWWVAGLAISIIVVFLLFGWLKGFLWEKEQNRNRKNRHHGYSH